MDNPTVLGGKTNIFGLAFFVVWTFGLIAIVHFVAPFPAIRRQALAMGLGIFLMVPDLLWRYRQPSGGIWRFISDIHGGAVAYIPAWIWMPFISSLAAFVWLAER